jgi:polyphenol oxidase
VSPSLNGPLSAFDSLEFIEYDFGTRISTPPSDVVTVRQIHSARVISNQGARSRQDEADALIENTPGIAIGVKTADCAPILLADPVTRAVAAVHAGWRGTAASIAVATVRAMTAEFGTKPEDLRAAIGPSIGSCCFEVGPEVALEFGVISHGRVRLDLPRMNAKQLESTGVARENISIISDCTKCGVNKYHSFRRDREAAGRMISWARIKA